eukprot:6175437-Pleurochrysis_carterae.AAC.1
MGASMLPVARKHRRRRHAHHQWFPQPPSVHLLVEYAYLGRSHSQTPSRTQLRLFCVTIVYAHYKWINEHHRRGRDPCLPALRSFVHAPCLQAEAEAAALRAALSDRGHQHVFDLNATATRDAGQLDACRRELRACEEALAATSDTDTKLRAELAEARTNERNAKDGIACAERRAEAAVARLEEAETQLRARDVEVARQRAELAAAQARAECAERHAAALSSWQQNVTDPSERSY